MGTGYPWLTCLSCGGLSVIRTNKPENAIFPYFLLSKDVTDWQARILLGCVGPHVGLFW